MRGPDVGRSWLKVALGCSVSSWTADGGGRGRFAKPACWLYEARRGAVQSMELLETALTSLTVFATKSRNNNNSSIHVFRQRARTKREYGVKRVQKSSGSLLSEGHTTGPINNLQSRVGVRTALHAAGTARCDTLAAAFPLRLKNCRARRASILPPLPQPVMLETAIFRKCKNARGVLSPLRPPPRRLLLRLVHRV